MTVQQLIDELSKLPPNHPVIVQDYEQGWFDVSGVTVDPTTAMITVR